MNYFSRFMMLVFAITLAACGGDDDSAKNCAQSDWVGTYTGTVTCDNDPAENVTVTITADGANAIVIKYETTLVETEYDPLTPNSCDLEQSLTQGGASATIDAMLDGNTFTLNEVLTVGGVTSTCDITATRQ